MLDGLDCKGNLIMPSSHMATPLSICWTVCKSNIFATSDPKGQAFVNIVSLVEKYLNASLDVW